MQSANEAMKKKAILVAVIALTLVAAVGAMSRSKMMANNVSVAGVQPSLASVAAIRPIRQARLLPVRLRWNTTPTARHTLAKRTSTPAGHLTPTFSVTRKLGRRTHTGTLWGRRSPTLRVIQ